MKFSTDLWDGFPLVVKKTECGLQSCKDILQFYRKRAQIEEEYSKALVKLCISATSEKRMIFRGRGTSSVIAESPSLMHGWECVIASTERAAKLHGETSKRFMEQCAEPVASFIKDMERQREKLVQEGTKLTKEYEEALALVDKTKSLYLKSSTECEVAEKELADPKLRENPKNAARLSSTSEKAKQTEADYRDKISTANQLQEKFMKEAMPKVLDELEHWESVRSHLVKTNIKKFLYACEKVPETLKECNAQMQQGIGVIDSQLDIERFVEENKTYNVPPPPIEFEAYVPGNVTIDKKKSFNLSDLGSNLGSLARKASEKAANLANAGASTAFHFVTKEEKKEGIFEVPLDEVMALQKDQPELEVPKILKTLTKAVIDMGGCQTEGIFRVPASATEVQALKKQFNQGNYDVEGNSRDVHAPAALLKLWLRSLPDPLVPTSLYENAVTSSNPEGAHQVFSKLPPLNAKIIKELVLFLSVMAHPDNVQKTLMNLDNLAMVFAPSLLRCPSEDPSVILASAKPEQLFLRNLILALAPPEQATALEAPAPAPPKAERDDSDEPLSPLEDQPVAQPEEQSPEGAEGL